MLNFYNFFTVWIFILVLFHQYTHKIFSLPFLTFIVMINGLYFSYINPGKFVLHDGDIEYQIVGLEKFIVDAFLHIGVFLFILQNYTLDSIFDAKIFASILLIALYSIIYYPSDIYLIHISEITVVFIFSVLLYAICNIIYTFS